MLKPVWCALSGVLLLSACATATVGSKRMVLVDTDNGVHAECLLENGHGQWVVARTPGVALVQGSRHDLSVSCTAPGGWFGQAEFAHEIGYVSYGNTIIGGLLGTATDIGTGAKYEYESKLIVPMARR